MTEFWLAGATVGVAMLAGGLIGTFAACYIWWAAHK